MNRRFLSPLAMLSLSVLSAQASQTAPVQPGEAVQNDGFTKRLLTRPWSLFERPGKEASAPKTVSWKSLVLESSVEPLPLKLSENRQFKVTLKLYNKSKKLQQLEFPTSQRIEVLVRNSKGKVVEQWSEDQAFAQDLTLVSINPGERLEYTVSVASRDLVAGEHYVVEAFFPNFDQLRSTHAIVPEK